MTSTTGPIAIMAATAAVLFARPAAAADEEAQLWTTVIAQTAVAPALDVGIELQTRSAPGGVRQLLVRPSVTLKLSDTVSATAGYLYFRNDPERGRTTNEHRSWQQLAFPLSSNSSGLQLTARTRLEQRFPDGGGETAWRLRQQVRGQLPVRAGAKTAWVAWNETFVGFNGAAWGARRGFDQTRTFVGINTPLGARANLDIGYLNQFIRRAGPDQVNHALAMTATTRF